MGLPARAEDAERAAGSCVLVCDTVIVHPGDVLDIGRPRVEDMGHLSGADNSKRNVRQATRSLEDQLEAVQRRRLAHEQDMEVLPPLPGVAKEALLGAEVTHGDLVDSRQLGHVVRVGSRVGHEEIRCTKGCAVEAAKRLGGERTVAEPLPVLDESVVERHHRVEDHRFTVPLRAPYVELARIADDQRVEVVRYWCTHEPELRTCESGKNRRAEAELVRPGPHVLVQ